MATVSTACPNVAGRRSMPVTVPEKIIPEARTNWGKPDKPGEATGKRNEEEEEPAGCRGGGTSRLSPSTESSAKSGATGAVALPRPACPTSQIGDKASHETASRHLPHLPNMGADLTHEPSARRVSGNSFGNTLSRKLNRETQSAYPH